jgi:hypothetical protein
MRRTSRKWASGFVGAAVFVSGVSAALGQSWNNPAGGSYGSLTDWTPNGIPTNPTFDLNSAGYTVTLPSAESAQTLVVDGQSDAQLEWPDFHFGRSERQHAGGADRLPDGTWAGKHHRKFI